MSSVTQPLIHNPRTTTNNYLTERNNQDVLVKSGRFHQIQKHWKLICGLAIIVFIGVTTIFSNVGEPHSLSSAAARLYEAEEWMEIDYIPEEDRLRRNLWEAEETCSPDTTFTMQILPVLQHMDELHKMVMEVSDPKSPKYGQYYDIEFINKYFGASSESLDAIYDWLDAYGLDIKEIKEKSKEYGGDMIEFETTCGLASKMLNTDYVVWQHVATGDEAIGVESNYYVPSSLSEHIDLIGPTLRFPLSWAKKEKLKLADTYYIGKYDEIENIEKYMQTIEPSLVEHLKRSRDERNKKMVAHQSRIHQHGDFSYVSPDVLWDLYSMEDYKDSAADGTTNKQAFGSWLSEYTEDSDTEEFYDEWGIESKDLERIPSNQTDDDAGFEASLDLQYITSTGQNIYTQEWYTDDDSDFWIITFLIKLRKWYTKYGDNDLPYVVSMSYGAVESESGETLVKKANSLIGTLSLYGMTFLASSGDSGAAGDGGCNGEFSPDFPTALPYVLSVGGVYGGDYPVNHSNTDEEAWYYGGGGFSNYFMRSEWATWQSDAVDYWVDNYSSDLTADSSWYNSSGRGYPDVSAQSYYFLVVDSGEWWLVSGTSASCPTVAGQIALLNDLRIQNGQSTIGLVQPSLYDMWDDLDYYINDVTDGYNEGCTATDDIGFYATSKWDPATGLGTPKFDRWVEYFVNTTSR